MVSYYALDIVLVRRNSYPTAVPWIPSCCCSPVFIVTPTLIVSAVVSGGPDEGNSVYLILLCLMLLVCAARAIVIYVLISSNYNSCSKCFATYLFLSAGLDVWGRPLAGFDLVGCGSVTLLFKVWYWVGSLSALGCVIVKASPLKSKVYGPSFNSFYILSCLAFCSL